MRKPAIVTLLSLLTLAACESGSRSRDGSLGGEHRSMAQASSDGEQHNGGCPSAPTTLLGNGEAGASCTAFADCQPVCCSCSASTRSWLAAACVAGVCASAAATCARTESSLWCGGSSSRDAAVSPPLDRAPAGAPVCVDGTSSSCYGSGVHWTGQLCCVDGPAVCVAGTSSSCYGTGERWTGKLCCVDGPATCVDGTSSSCYGTDERWTGSVCCIDGIANCVAGSSSSCYGSGQYWTGKLCCVK